MIRSRCRRRSAPYRVARPAYPGHAPPDRVVTNGAGAGTAAAREPARPAMVARIPCLPPFWRYQLRPALRNARRSIRLGTVIGFGALVLFLWRGYAGYFLAVYRGQIALPLVQTAVGSAGLLRRLVLPAHAAQAVIHPVPRHDSGGSVVELETAGVGEPGRARGIRRVVPGGHPAGGAPHARTFLLTPLGLVTGDFTWVRAGRWLGPSRARSASGHRERRHVTGVPVSNQFAPNSRLSRSSSPS